MKCKCLELVNKKLQEVDAGVYLKYLKLKPIRLIVATERRTGKGKVKPLVATYCPFCGVKYEETK